METVRLIGFALIVTFLRLKKLRRLPSWTSKSNNTFQSYGISKISKKKFFQDDFEILRLIDFVLFTTFLVLEKLRRIAFRKLKSVNWCVRYRCCKSSKKNFWARRAQKSLMLKCWWARRAQQSTPELTSARFECR